MYDDLIGLEPDVLYDDEYAVAGMDELDDYEDDGLDAIAGLDDFDEEDLDAIAGGYELVGLDLGDEDYEDDDLDAIAGMDGYDELDDLDEDELAVSGAEDDEEGYALPGSVEELLEAGATAGRGRRRMLGRRVRGRRVRRRGGSYARARALRARRARARAARARLLRARRARASRTRRTVRTLGRRVRRERALRRRAVRAARAVRSAPRPARTRAVPNVTGGTTKLVKQTPQLAGPQVVPFTAPTPIAPGETRVLTARPQVIFRPDSFRVAGRIAEYFRINAIRIGNQNQFAASGSVPAEAFSGVSPMPIGNTTAQPGHDIAIEVTNISASPQDFSAAMSGPALQ